MSSSCSISAWKWCRSLIGRQELKDTVSHPFCQKPHSLVRRAVPGGGSQIRAAGARIVTRSGRPGEHRPQKPAALRQSAPGTPLALRSCREDVCLDAPQEHRGSPSQCQRASRYRSSPPRSPGAGSPARCRCSPRPTGGTSTSAPRPWTRGRRPSSLHQQRRHAAAAPRLRRRRLPGQRRNLRDAVRDGRRHAAEEGGAVPLRRRKRRRGPRDGRERALLPDPDEARDPAALGRRRRAGERGPARAVDRHLLIVDRDNRRLYELYNVYFDGQAWHAGSGRLLRPDAQRPAARRLDVGRRGRSGDPAGPGAVRRGVRPATRSATPSA